MKNILIGIITISPFLCTIYIINILFGWPVTLGNLIFTGFVIAMAGLFLFALLALLHTIGVLVQSAFQERRPRSGPFRDPDIRF